MEICSLWSNWQQISIASDNGSAQNKHQAIIWTIDDIVYWCIYEPAWIEMSRSSSAVSVVSIMEKFFVW